MKTPPGVSKTKEILCTYGVLIIYAVLLLIILGTIVIGAKG